MATPRKVYPSDHRRWFRVLEDILDDERLNALSLADQALYFRLLAVLNRQKSKDGVGRLDTFAACALAQRERWAYARPAFDRIAAGGLVAVRYRDGGITYQISKWPELQGFAPLTLRRNSVRTPSPTPTPTPTPNSESEAGRASKAARPPDSEPESEPAAPASGRGAWTPGPEDRAVIDFNALRLAARSVK